MANRIQYFDAAKGFAIFAVLVMHLTGFLGVKNPWVIHFICSFYMPIFFMISGYFGYKPVVNGWGLLAKRSKELILPYLTVGVMINCFYCLLFDKNFFDHFIFDETKGGFWFLLVLFELVLIYVFARKLSKGSDVKMFGILFFLYAGVVVVAHLAGDDVSHLLSLYSVRKYLPFFIVGLLFGKYKTVFPIASPRMCLISGVAYGLLLLIPIEKTYGGQMIWTVCAMAGSVFILNFFCYVKPACSLFAKVGPYSLTIYIYHYIVMYSLAALIPQLTEYTYNVGVILLMVIGAAVITALFAWLGKLCSGWKYKYVMGL